jgi:hypothetical protein
MASGLEEHMAAQLAQQTLSMAQATEKQLDAELRALSQLDTNDLEAIRRRRIEEMKQRASKEVMWRSQGHLEYTELRDEKQWFEASKENERMVCHFYRGTTWRCEIIDRHLEAIARKHIETKFCKINAENCPFLAEKLNIVLLPTLIMTKDNFVADRIEGFDELGGRDDFTAEVLERRLAKQQTIDFEEAPVKSLANKKLLNKGSKSNPNGKAIYASSSNRRGDASDDDENEESDED